MALWVKTEPTWLNFSKPIHNQKSKSPQATNTANLQEKIKYSKSKLEALIKECFEVRKLSFTDTVIEVGVSPTTVRRVCRTLKIGRYSEQIPLELRSNSSQQPYGWKSINGVLEKDPAQWRYVELIFQLREQGLSLHKIADHLTHLKVPTKNGGQWFAKTISQIMKFNQQFINQ